ncbi:MAG: ABC transporter ATP-binding protein [Oscillospiraceae bacterium]|nr:ABC transporter ATP-binding protein [Oscillospiraceae bacterium]
MNKKNISPDITKEPGHNPKNKLDMKTAKRLISYLSQYRLRLIAVIICILISSLAGVASILFIRTLIDNFIDPLLNSAVPDYSDLIKVLIAMGLIYLAGIVATWMYNRFMVIIAQGTLKKIRDEMFAKMQLLPISYFDRHTHGDIMSHYTNDTDTLRQMIAQSLAQIISSVFSLIAVFFSMLYLSVWLTLIVIVSIYFIMQLIKFITRKSGRYFMQMQQSLGELNGYIEEMTAGQKVVKIFCREEQTMEAFEKKNDYWRTSAQNANGYANTMMPMVNALGYMQYVIIAVAGGYLAISQAVNLTVTGTNTMTLGMIASFLTLSRNFTNPIAQISNQFNSIITALAGASRIFELMDEEPETDDGYVTLVRADIKDGVINETQKRTGTWAWKHPHGDGTTTYTKLEGNVVLDDVDFGYVPDKLVLHNISLYAHSGQKIAFVGATGAGKTTITNLINRFYDIADGKIRYDAININKIRKSDLRRSLGVVLQDVNLFTGTVMENIRYGNPEATDEQCIAASKLANAHNFIKMLPEGYNTVLKGDSGGLSQGQRQLISIARAAVADPPVMILDEATSSIDTRTEELVARGMDKLMEGRTVFVIAHRLSTVKNSDVIMVLDHGEIIERGDHQSLIERKGTYYRLYTGAFELE